MFSLKKLRFLLELIKQPQQNEKQGLQKESLLR